jgi:hypothetical protein
MPEPIEKVTAVMAMALTFAVLVWGQALGQSSSGGSLYESSLGLSPVSIDDSIALAIPDQAREMPLRIIYPEQGGPHPVIVLSHGTFSSGKRYDPVAIYPGDYTGFDCAHRR